MQNGKFLGLVSRMATQVKYKLALLGAPGVGKTSLTLQMISTHFTLAYDPTQEDSYRKQVSIAGKTCILDILDIGGQEYQDNIMSNPIMKSDGFICVYAITSRYSIEDVAIIREQLLRVNEYNPIPMVLVGNKIDIVDERQITTEEGSDLANSFSCPFYETSCKDRVNIEEAFFSAIREIEKYQIAHRSKKHKNKKECCLM